MIVRTDQVALKVPNFVVFLTTLETQAKSMLWLNGKSTKVTSSRSLFVTISPSLKISICNKVQSILPLKTKILEQTLATCYKLMDWQDNWIPPFAWNFQSIQIMRTYLLLRFPIYDYHFAKNKFRYISLSKKDICFFLLAYDNELFENYLCILYYWCISYVLLLN